MTDAISIIVNLLDANWSKSPKPSIQDIATLDKGDSKRVRLNDRDVIRIFETAHNEAQPELLYDFVNEHINLTLDIRTVKSRERLSVLRNEVRRILHGFRKGDNKNIDRIIFKTRTDLSDRSKKLFRYTMQCEVVTFSLTAGSESTFINPATNQISGADVFQSLSTTLTEISLLTPTANYAIMGNGTNWVTSPLGDITDVVAGTGLTGGGSSGSVTLNVSGLTLSELDASSLQLSSESFVDNDTTVMTSAAVLDKIQAELAAYTSGVDLTAGTGILIQSETNVDSGDYSATIALDLKDEDDMSSDSATHAASQQSIKAYVDTSVSNLVDGAPGVLDTLNELAAALGDDANFVNTVLLKSNNLSDLPSASTARSNLGLGDLATQSLANGGENRIITSTSSSTLNAEATLTYDGAKLEINNGAGEVIGIGGGGAGYQSIEIGGDTGAYIDLKSPNSDDYDLRIISTGSGGTVQTSSPLTFQTGSDNSDITLSPHGTGNVQVNADLVVTGDLSVAGGYGLTATDIPSLDASKIGTGTFNDDRIAESNVTQHLAVAAGGGIGLSGKTFSLNIDGMSDIGADLVDADLMIVDDGAAGTNRKATMSRLRTYMQNNLTFTTDTNTNQLTTFTLDGDTGSSQTIAHGSTLLVAGGSGVNTVVSSSDTITINHDDTSSQANVSNTGRTYIQSVTLDTYGHVTGLTSATETVTNTDVDVNVSNLTARLPQITDSFTIGDASDVTVTTAGDLVVSGDLTVSGDTVTVNTATLSVEDPLIFLANGQTGTPSVDMGFIGERGTSSNVGIIWDESADTFSAINTTDTGTTAGNVTIDSYANFRANTFTGSLSGNATTATSLASPVNIAGQSFDGSSSITIATTDLSDITALDTDLSSVSGSDDTLASAKAIKSYVDTQIAASGDITEVVAGSGLTGGASSGIATLNVGSGTGISVAADSISLTVSGISSALESGLVSTDELIISDNGTVKRMDVSVLQSYMQSNLTFTTDTNTQNVFTSSFVDSTDDIILRLTQSGAGSGTQDITMVAGSGITLDHDSSSQITISTTTADNNATITLSAGTGLSGGGDFTTNQSVNETITFNVADLTVSQIAANSILLSTETFLDSETMLMTAKAINDRIESFGYTTNVGDITGVTAGTLLGGGGDSGSVTLNVDLSELSTSTSDADGDFFVVVDDANAQKKLTKANINISGFNNDSAFIDNTVTSLTSLTTVGPSSGSLTVQDDLVVSGDLTVSGTQTIINTETLTVDDNIIVLNNNAASTPTENAGIEVERGDSTNTVLRWNETSDRWQFTNDGSTYYNIPISSEYTANVGDITGVTAGSGLTGGGESGAVTLSLDDPGNLAQLTETTDAIDDKILLWDQSASSWKYMTLDDLQDSIDTASATGIAGSISSSQVAFGTGADTIGGEADFTYDTTDNVLEVDKIVSHIVIKVQNDTGSTIPKGQAVYVDAEGTNPSVAPALATNATKMPSIGLAQEALATTGVGYVCVNGIITVSSSIIDDTLSDPGDVGKTLYVSETTAGNLTITKPTSPNDLVQNVGKIADITGSNVMIIVSNIGRSNDVPNTIDIEGNISTDGTIYVADSYIRDDGANLQIVGNNQIQFTANSQFGQFIFYNEDGQSGGVNVEQFRITHQGTLQLANNRTNKTIAMQATDHDVAGRDLTLSAGDTTAGTTDNIAGGDLILQGGQGKGTGAGGSITFQVADGGSSGSSLNSLATAMTIADDGNVGIGTTSPATALDVRGNLTIDQSGASGTTGELHIKGSRTANIEYAKIDFHNKDGDSGNFDYVGARISVSNAPDAVNDGSMAFSVNNSNSLAEAMRIVDTGRVGIGTTTPDAMLNIESTGATRGIRVDATATNQYAEAQFNADSREYRIGAGGSTSALVNKFYIYDQTATTTRLAIDSSGNVGIGTSSPEYKLDVQSGTIRILPTISSNAGTAIRIGANGDSNDITMIRIDGSTNQNQGESDSLQAGLSMKYMGSGTGDNNRFALVMDDVLTGPSVEAISVLQDGKVGIGTATPSYLLDVDGNARFGTTGVAGNIYLSADAAGSYIGWNSSGTDVTLAADDDLVLHADDAMLFQAGAATKMTLLSSGDLGIGTTSPASKLHVVGDANDEVVALFTTAGGTSGTVEGIAHIGLSHFSSDTVPSVSISAEEIDVSDHRADFRINTRTSATSNAVPTEKVRVTYDGKVGIGTATPSGVLHVTADDTSAEAFRVDITDTDATADSTPFVIDGDGRVGIGTASPVAGMALTLNGDGTTYEGIAFQSGGSTKWHLTSDGSAWYHDSRVNTLDYNIRLRDNTGTYQIFHMNADTAGTLKVGIGTNSPDYELDVAGDIGVDQYIYHNGDTDTYINMADDDFRIVVGNDLAFHYDEGSSSKLHLSYNGEADVEIGNAGGTPDFFFGGSQGSYNGKVGIGTSAPSAYIHLKQSDTSDALILESTDSGSSLAPTFKFYRNSSTPAINDQIGRILWAANDDGGAESSYANIYAYIEDETALTENGVLTLQVAEAGSMRNNLVIGSTMMTVNSSQRNVDFRILSDDGSVNFYSDAGTNRVGIGTSTPTHTLQVDGDFAATTKSFDIEHPTKEGMRLHHGSLEGPEHGVYVRGKLQGNVIDLPDYWEGLVDEDTITVQLTPNKKFQQIYVQDVLENKVYVASQDDEPVDCFYFIQAERKDVERFEVEY